MDSTTFILFWGDTKTKKVSLPLYLDLGHYCDEWNPAMRDTFRIKRKINDVEYSIEVLEDDELNEYSAIRDKFIHRNCGFVIVYSVAMSSSFMFIDEYIQSAKNCGEDGRAPILLVGSECELKEERQVSTEEGMEMAEKYNIPFIEVSAKTGERMEEMLKMIIDEMNSLCQDNSNGTSDKDDKGMKNCEIQ